MGALPKFDSEDLQYAVYNILVNSFNAQLDAVTADKALNTGAVVLNPALAYIGNTLDNAAAAIDVMDTNRNAYGYDPYLWIAITKDESMQNKGDYVVDITVFVSLTDPRDTTGEIRIARYTRVLRELFSPMQGVNIGIVPISGTEALPVIPTPDPIDPSARRLTGGLKISCAW
jgi:hypothetical protein